jgi:tripartite-type tricarboxylate transporter receptor subunit TctC
VLEEMKNPPSDLIQLRTCQGMDGALVRRLNAELAKVVQAPEIRTVYEKIGADPITMTPEAFEKATQAEITKLAPVVKASGAKVD